MSTLDQMEIFYFVATWNSFSRAAIKLGVSKGYVSTQITELEKKLQTKLLYRTTRHLGLTEEGSLFLESCSKIVSEKKFAISNLEDLHKEPSGQLNITAPPSMCSTLLAELLPKFQSQHPKISLAIHSSSQVLNLLQHDIDLALRITTSPDENSVARLITTFRFVICATPQYLSQYGIPKIPEDLLQHNCLIYSSDPASNNWPTKTLTKEKTIPIKGSLTSSDSAIIKNSLMLGHGIARLPEYILAQEIKDNRLTVLFSTDPNIKAPLYAIYLKQNNTAAKIKTFIKFLQDHFQTIGTPK